VEPFRAALRAEIHLLEQRWQLGQVPRWWLGLGACRGLSGISGGGDHGEWEGRDGAILAIREREGGQAAAAKGQQLEHPCTHRLGLLASDRLPDTRAPGGSSVLLPIPGKDQAGQTVTSAPQESRQPAGRAAACPRAEWNAPGRRCKA